MGLSVNDWDALKKGNYTDVSHVASTSKEHLVLSTIICPAQNTVPPAKR